MSRIQYIDDEGGNFQEVHGSDSRFNVSSRSNDREFYVSRDEGQAYVMVSTDNTIAVGSYLAYWKNTSPDKNLHILDITVNATAASQWQITTVTGTAAAGSGTSTLAPANLNRTSNNDAAAAVFHSGHVTGLTQEAIYYHNQLPTNGHHDENFFGALILGQNDAVAVKYVAGARGTGGAIIFGYYE